MRDLCLATGVSALLLMGAAGAAQRPSSSTGTTGAARITGQITAEADGQPLARVLITLTGPTPGPLTTLTDERGEYALLGMPPGAYALTAGRSGYLTVQYGQRRPREAGRRIELGVGEALMHMDIELSRAAVVAGTVVDERGEPVPGARVEAMEPRLLDWRRVVVPAGIATTDDVGAFRISGLNPGRYTLRASTMDTWEGSDKRETYAHAVTYYPGSALSERAQSIQLAVGQEIANLNFALSVERATRLSGRAQNADGKPMPNQPVTLSRLTGGVGGALLPLGPGRSVRTKPDGSFQIDGIPPGDYQLGTALGSTETVTRLLALSGTDIANIVLTGRRVTTLSGTITTDEATPLPFPTQRLQVVATRVGGDDEGQPGSRARRLAVRADGAFSFPDVDGQYIFRVNGLPDDWMVRSVTLNGRDITDAPFEIPQGSRAISGLRLVLSHTGASVTGVVLDAHGAPLLDSSVVVFAESASMWGPGSRFVRSVRPDQDGKFVVAGLPAGTYMAKASDFVADGQWEDPAFLENLRPDAMRIVLPESTSQELTLKVEMK